MKNKKKFISSNIGDIKLANSRGSGPPPPLDPRMNELYKVILISLILYTGNNNNPGDRFNVCCIFVYMSDNGIYHIKVNIYIYIFILCIYCICVCQTDNSTCVYAS